jgi:Flp pilus assembly protein TadD
MTRMNIAAAFVSGAVLLTPFTAIAISDEENPAAAELDPDYAAGKKAIEAKHWSAAITALSAAALRDTRNADIQNYLGYAYRNAGQLDAAFRHYQRALTLSPRHRGAHEYVGEAYLIVGNLAKAEEHLEALQQICLIPCEEFEDLKKKIDAYKRSSKR